MKKGIGLVLIIAALLFVLSNLNSKKNEGIDKTKLEIVEPKYEYGIRVDTFNIIKGVVKQGQTFGEILYANHIDHPQIAEIVIKSKGIFDFRRVNSGKEYTIICEKDSLEKVHYFIYQENFTSYIVIDMTDEIDVYRGEKEITTKLKLSCGEINSSLSESVEKLKISPRVSIKLAEIYAWTIDFSRIQKDDKFKIIYNERYIEDTILVGIKSIDAAYFEHNKEEIYAFNFVTDSLKNTTEFYDDKGNSLERTFLKSPLRYSNISSRYNLKRRIAYYGNKVRPHKGTDFAAPVGTPIMATADGRVVKSSFTKGNGYYVKIQHNNKYSTQYLHMQKKGRIKKGSYVKQGDVIGKVGMTGNTSGPHVCYRFWKNNKQVDPFKQKLPPGKPVSKNLKVKYDNYILPLKTELNQIK